jgi:hypothetical protein
VKTAILTIEIQVDSAQDEQEIFRAAQVAWDEGKMQEVLYEKLGDVFGFDTAIGLTAEVVAVQHEIAWPT